MPKLSQTQLAGGESAGDRDRAALEQGPGDQLGVIPGRRVADCGQGEVTSAGRPALRPRWGDQAVELTPSQGHRDLRVARWIEDVRAHRPVGAVVAAGVDPAE